MGLISWMKAVRNKLFGKEIELFKKEIEEQFGADVLLSSEMKEWIEKFDRITSGHPYWEKPEDDIRSINFAAQIDDFTAGLVTLDAKIEFPDTPRGRYLQVQADYVLQVLKEKVAEALGSAGVMFKPNGKNVDYVTPGNFVPTDIDSNGNIWGCAFQEKKQIDDKFYTHFEWHRFESVGEEHIYRITHYAYKALGPMGIGKRCDLSEVPDWAYLEEDTAFKNVKKPLFSYFKNPAPNRLDRGSPLGVPIWVNCLKEMEDLDIAWSRKSGEVEDSKHITFLPESAIRYAEMRNLNLPRWLKGIEMGKVTDRGDTIHEHVSTLLTEQRISDINSILAMISMKCGFSQGTFVFDEKQGVKTATEIEADEQETIRTIKNIRDALQACLEDLFYALNIFIDRYEPKEAYPAEDWDELISAATFDFGNILYNYTEDKNYWFQYMTQGYAPAYKYFQKFEGMSEYEARQMVAEARLENMESEQGGLFGEETYRPDPDEDETDKSGGGGLTGRRHKV